MSTIPELSRDKGFTLVEFLVAIVITSALIGLIFTAYVQFQKGFLNFSQNSDKVQKMIVAKNKIDQVFRNITRIETTHGKTIEFIHAGTGKKSIVKYTADTLFLDNKKITALKDFSFSFSDKKNKENQFLLLWEAMVFNNKYWIGGAALIRKDES